MKFSFSEEVSGALHFGSPIVALESTVIAHGLPYPQNIETAYKLERIVRDNGAVPATIGVFDGEICVGLNEDQIAKLVTEKNIRKISHRDIPIAVAQRLNCATTVSSTAFIAHRAGIKVFATGGIGGVHRGDATDVSADLPELANTPIIVVCSGAKIILDLPATREWLETHGVPVLGWECDTMPAFHAVSSGLAVDARVDEPKDVAKIAAARDELAMTNAVLVTVPVPAQKAIDGDVLEKFVSDAVAAADAAGVKGKELTPFLLSEMSARSEGQTLTANIALLENNARVAARIAAAL